MGMLYVASDLATSHAIFIIFYVFPDFQMKVIFFYPSLASKEHASLDGLGIWMNST